jgi:hypothetical protein
MKSIKNKIPNEFGGRIIIGLACFLILLSTSACSPNDVASVNELKFEDPETGQRFRKLDSCIKKITNFTWRQIPYSQGGNFYESRWCRGSGANDNCVISSGSSDNRNQQLFELYTLFYSRSFPEVFGLGFSFDQVPKSTGWGVSFSFAESGGGVVSESWSVSIKKYTNPTGPPELSVRVGRTYGYRVLGSSTSTRFHQFSDLPVREDLAIYLSGAAAMRDRGLVQRKALEQKVIAAIKSHQLQNCDHGPYLGDGIPPVCTPRPYTPEEEAEQLSLAKAHFAEQEQLLRTYYQELYDLWMMAFPFDECWE